MSIEPQLAEPSPERKPSFAVTGLLVAFVVGLWLMVWGELLLWVPQAQKTFNDFGLKLPVLTQTVLEFSQWVNRNTILTVPVVLAFAAMFGVLIGICRHRRGWASLTTVLALLLMIGLAVANVVIVGSLMLATVKLQEGLAK